MTDRRSGRSCDPWRPEASLLQFLIVRKQLSPDPIESPNGFQGRGILVRERGHSCGFVNRLRVTYLNLSLRPRRCSWRSAIMRSTSSKFPLADATYRSEKPTCKEFKNVTFSSEQSMGLPDLTSAIRLFALTDAASNCGKASFAWLAS